MLAAIAPFAAAAEPVGSAEALLRQGRFDDALDRASEEVRANPDDVRAQELVVDILLSAGKPGVAVARASAWIERDPGNPDAHYLLGRASLEVGESRRAYEAALRLAPGHGRSHMGMGSIHEAAGRTEAASAAYAAAVEFEPGLGEAWLGRARTLAQGRQPEAALRVAREGLGHVPGEAGLALVVAQLDPRGARGVLERALAEVGPDAQLYGALAEVHLLGGRASAARELADKSVALAPQLPGPRRTRALAREVERGWLSPDALAALRAARRTAASDAARGAVALGKLVASSPRSAMVRLERAALHASRGDEEAELADLLAAVRLDPGNDEVAAVAGLTLMEAGRASEARPLLQQALGTRPWDPQLGVALARALAGSGASTDARQLLERVASAHPTYVEAQLAYAQSLLDAGDPARAYGVAKVSMQLTQDARLLAAFVKIAPLAGRAAEAADVLTPLAERSGSAHLRQVVDELRRQAQ